MAIELKVKGAREGDTFADGGCLLPLLHHAWGRVKEICDYGTSRWPEIALPDIEF